MRPAHGKARATVDEVRAAIQRSNHHLTGESLEGLLEALGWTKSEYVHALVTEAAEKIG
jgi:hypothetical protein